MVHRTRIDSTPVPLDLDKLPAYLRPVRRDAYLAGDTPRPILRRHAEHPVPTSAWGDYIAEYEGHDL